MREQANNDNMLCGTLKEIFPDGTAWAIQDNASGQVVELKNGGLLEVFRKAADGSEQPVLKTTVALDYTKSERLSRSGRQWIATYPNTVTRVFLAVKGVPSESMAVSPQQWREYFKRGYAARYTPPAG